MTLLEKRIAFSAHVASLLFYARLHKIDYIIDQVRRDKMVARWNSEHCKYMFDGIRCEREQHKHVNLNHEFEPIGISNSLHLDGLAIDLLVIDKGQISNDEQPYKLLGLFWETLFKDSAWGGRFGDMGHFSYSHDGRK